MMNTDVPRLRIARITGGVGKTTRPSRNLHVSMLSGATLVHLPPVVNPDFAGRFVTSYARYGGR
ncbi:MAG TPA: hypothetical protein VJM10_07450 [Candidatus Methylomirabilis sp.]|nr:hypothetical protein [Candidatus Methylomirabilis sp.]